jgi:hypothetical protein
LFAYTGCVANLRTCIVSFVDHEGITHAVEVSASSLYEAAALALVQFRRCGFTDANPGLATRLTVAVKMPATTHEVTVRKLQDWLNGGAKSPRELVLKNRLKELVG